MLQAYSRSTWALASQGGYRWQFANCGRRYATRGVGGGVRGGWGGFGRGSGGAERRAGVARGRKLALWAGRQFRCTLAWQRAEDLTWPIPPPHQCCVSAAPCPTPRLPRPTLPFSPLTARRLFKCYSLCVFSCLAAHPAAAGVSSARKVLLEKKGRANIEFPYFFQLVRRNRVQYGRPAVVLFPTKSIGNRYRQEQKAHTVSTR